MTRKSISKNAVVIGLARSGVGAANLLLRDGWDVTITDLKPASALSQYIGMLAPGVKTALGGHPDGLIEAAALVIVSPGVPSDAPQLKRARVAGADIIGELELAFRRARHIPFYAVTGTNGKSTTTTLLDMMMRASGRRCFMGGNIGRSIAAAIAEHGGMLDAQCVVAEVSSFQLETISEFRPKGSTVLNITPDHLDRYHHSMEEYTATKAAVAKNQGKGDYIVLNADDPLTRGLYETYFPYDRGVDVCHFSRAGSVRGIYLGKGGIIVTYPVEGVLMRADEVRIKGVHNLENAMAAALMALMAGCPMGPVAGVLREFPGLEHRLEFVRELDGVRYINDSKGTNVDAVLKSLEGFTGKVVLIAGGRDKAGEFEKLRELAHEKTRAVVLIGEAASKIGKALDGAAECRSAGTFDEAIRLARSLARPGDAVLLSPACASFDMFRDYEDRGMQFKEIVGRL